MTIPHSLAEAWVRELTERGLQPAQIAEANEDLDAARNLFYAGAAAMLAMVAGAGQDGTYSLLLTVMAELKEYLEDA